MGDLLKGAFGTMGAQAEPEAAGAAAPTAPEPQQLQHQLQTMDRAARTAVGRLTALLPIGALDEATHTGLMTTFTTIQANLADMSQRVATATGETGLEVQKDVNELQTQVQDFVEAVEKALADAKVAVKNGNGAVLAQRAPMTQLTRTRLMLWGALALGVGAAAWGFWQMNKEKKPAKK